MQMSGKSHWVIGVSAALIAVCSVSYGAEDAKSDSGARSTYGSGARSTYGSGVRTAEIADSADLVVLGGLEAAGADRISVMGQEFDISGLQIDAGAMQMALGRLTYVEAKKGDKLPVATNVQVLDDLSIPGATSVFVRGPVDSVDGGIGQVAVGSLRIDLNNVAGGSPVVGEMLTVSGTQPAPSGPILGDNRF